MVDDTVPCFDVPPLDGRKSQPPSTADVSPRIGTSCCFLATRPVDFRNGMAGLAMLVRKQLGADPFCGTVFAFRSKRADRLKPLFFDGTGVVLVAKRLEAGAFRWHKSGDGAIRLTAPEMAALVDGLDWRVHMPRETVVPRLAG